MRDEPRKPIVRKEIYLKYGFVKTEHTSYHCPRCSKTLNAGPNFQPKYCWQCGQRIDFNGIEWEKEKVLRYVNQE